MSLHVHVFIIVHSAEAGESLSQSDSCQPSILSGDSRHCSDVESELSDASSDLIPEECPSPVQQPTSFAVHSEDSSESASPLDIGDLLKRGVLRSLDNSMKLKLIKQSPDARFNYPVKFMHGCNRRFKPEWAQNHSWLHYSPSEDGVYCKACVLFAPADIKRQKLGLLVNKPFFCWTKQSSFFNSHEQLAYHQDSMSRMAAFKESCSNPLRNVATMLNKAHEEQVSRNAQVIKSLLKCVSFCGKQGLSFRGHRDDSTALDASNMGNFIELVRFRAENDDVLRTYLETSPRNALYTSKTIQNETIDVIGSAIEDQIIEKIQAAKFFTVLADEVTDCCNLEQVSCDQICGQ